MLIGWIKMLPRYRECASSGKSSPVSSRDGMRREKMCNQVKNTLKRTSNIETGPFFEEEPACVGMSVRTAMCMYAWADGLLENTGWYTSCLPESGPHRLTISMVFGAITDPKTLGLQHTLRTA